MSFAISSTLTIGQNNYQQYDNLVKKADSLYHVKDYKNAAFAYSNAFKSIGWIGTQRDRYNAACSWALAGVADSAFFQLDRIAKKANYIDYGQITTDQDLQSLHNDKRWEPLIQIVKENKDKAEVNLNKPLAARLDSIYIEDQKYRRQIDSVEKKYGWESKEMKSLWKVMEENDSVNLIKVKEVLDKYGWLGTDIIGERGTQALFLVIQHADAATQEKYLPMMREAVNNGRASGSDLALLEDRVALGQGKKQIYGSQIGRNQETGQYYILPLEDPDNVDKRRAQVGLQPLSEYVSYWQIKWDIEQYKKDLKASEAKEKVRPK